MNRRRFAAYPSSEYISELGYRLCFFVEGQREFIPTGTDKCKSIHKSLPIYCGPDFHAAEAVALNFNLSLGIGPDEVREILISTGNFS